MSLTPAIKIPYLWLAGNRSLQPDITDFGRDGVFNDSVIRPFDRKGSSNQALGSRDLWHRYQT
jgi:hypothetical protein